MYSPTNVLTPGYSLERPSSLEEGEMIFDEAFE